jgi:hypothetical protein
VLFQTGGSIIPAKKEESTRKPDNARKTATMFRNYTLPAVPDGNARDKCGPFVNMRKTAGVADGALPSTTQGGSRMPCRRPILGFL